ncbi:MAG TPA: alkaline phosphatase family protein [Gaiella sp.]
MTAPTIEHVVVLMLENRSFDHMLGWVSGGILPPLTEQDSVPRDPTDPQQFVHVFWHRTYSDVTVDPGHGLESVHRQLAGSDGPWSKPYSLPMNGFVWDYAERRTQASDGSPGLPPVRASEIMGCYPKGSLPVLESLAEAFAVCSRWHCSLPSETWPNRLFAHAGTSFGAVRYDRPLHDGPTIFDLLDAAGHGSRVYAGDVPQAITFAKSLLPDKVRLLNFFDGAARKDELRSYTFIEPHHFDTRLGKVSSQHPPHDVRRGDALLARVYSALRESPKWDRTLLIVTYDEHGGFFDRRPPPQVAAQRDSSAEFDFDLLGPRVPALIISPWVESGTVDGDFDYDHTSLTHTVREIFDIETSLSEREAASNTVMHLLTRDSPRTTEETPDLRAYANEDWFTPLERIEDGPLDDFQQQLLDLMRAVDDHRGYVAIEAEEALPVSERVARFAERTYPTPMGAEGSA